MGAKANGHKRVLAVALSFPNDFRPPHLHDVESHRVFLGNPQESVLNDPGSICIEALGDEHSPGIEIEDFHNRVVVARQVVGAQCERSPELVAAGLWLGRDLTPAPISGQRSDPELPSLQVCNLPQSIPGKGALCGVRASRCSYVHGGNHAGSRSRPNSLTKWPVVSQTCTRNLWLRCTATNRPLSIGAIAN